VQRRAADRDTFGDADGYRRAADIARRDKKLTPFCTKCESKLFSPENSEPPQLFETYCAWSSRSPRPEQVRKAVGRRLDEQDLRARRDRVGPLDVE